MSNPIFCPQCHKPAMRVEEVKLTLPPSPSPWMVEMDDPFAVGDEEREKEWDRWNEPRVTVLVAPYWRPILAGVNPNNMRNVSFGCPYGSRKKGCQGKILLFRE